MDLAQLRLARTRDANAKPKKQYEGIEVVGESVWDQADALGDRVDYSAGRLNKDGSIGRGGNAIKGGGGNMALEDKGKTR